MSKKEEDVIIEEMGVERPRKRVSAKAKKKTAAAAQEAKSPLAAFVDGESATKDEEEEAPNEFEQARHRIGDPIVWLHPEGYEVELQPFSAMCQLWFARLRDLMNLGDMGTMYIAIYLMVNNPTDIARKYRQLRVKREALPKANPSDENEVVEIVETVARGQIIEDIEEWINNTFSSVSDETANEVSRVFMEVFLRQQSTQTGPLDGEEDEEDEEAGK